MSEAEDLLATLSVDYSDEAYIFVNDDRTITVPDELKHIAVERDHNIETVTIDCPRYWDEHDFSVMNIYINYQRPDGYKDSYLTKNLRVADDDDTRILFDWTISANVTQIKGDLSFLVYIEDPDANPCWHSRLNQQMIIDEGLTCVEQNDILPDSIEGLLSRKIAVQLDDVKAQIDGKAAEALATIPDDYTTTYNLANEASRTKADAIICSAEGSTIFLSDSSDDYIRGLNVYGKTTQRYTNGAQLLNLPNGTVNSSGLTWVCNNGVITVSGTTTGTSSTSGTIDYSILGMTGQFVISGSSDKVSVYCSVTKNGNTAWYKDTSFTLDGTETTALIYCQVYSAGVSVNEVLYPMLTHGGTASEWEPYTGGKPAPSPNYPQELVTDTVKTIVDIFGSNLADVNGIQQGANTSATVSDDGYTITCIGGADNPYTSSPIELPMHQLAGRTVILKADSITNTQDSAGKGGNVQLNIRDSVKMKYVAISPNNLMAVTTFPVDLARADLNIYTNNSNAVFDTENTTVVKGLRLSVVDTDWEPYRESQMTDAYVTLRGIPVDSEGNYTDSNGQQWVCDEYDIGRGVHITRIGVMQFVGTEEWAISEQNPSEGYHGVLHTAVSDMLVGSTARCSHYIQGASVGLIGKSGQFDTYYGQLRINAGEFTSIDEWKATLAEWNDLGTPLTLMYILTTPVETGLHTNQITAFKSFTTNYRHTTILSSTLAHMRVTYNADTKTYLDRVVAEHAQYALTEQDKQDIADIVLASLNSTTS